MLTVLTAVLVGLGQSDADQQIVFDALIPSVVAGYGHDARVRDGM